MAMSAEYDSLFKGGYEEAVILFDSVVNLSYNKFSHDIHYITMLPVVYE
jgi:hypothetical protein